MRKFGLADLVGIISALVALTLVPGLTDPATYTKLLVLAAGGLGLLPIAVWRWRSGKAKGWPSLVIAGAAVLLMLWGLISLFFSGNPLTLSLFGWWGRGDGWLALAGAISLFLAASTLDGREVNRAITWMLGGATIAAAIGFLQFVGVSIAGSTGQVLSTMGNTNFAAGYFAMIFALALGRAFTRAALWQRIWSGLLALALVVLAWLTDAVQGPVALAGGAVAFGVIYALSYRGRYRVWGLVASGAVLVITGALVVLSFAGIGPLQVLWSQQTFQIRQKYWDAGWSMLNALPVFGSGPDGFARYVSEFRSEPYLELLGPTLRVSAAHNIPLHVGATMGYPALIFWLVTILGTLLYLVVRAAKGPVAQPVLAAAVGGALTAYIVQGLVSIDMLPILATGWTVAGLAFAVARQPAESILPVSSESSGTRRAKAAQAARASTPPSTPLWIPATGAVVALIVAVAVGAQVAASDQVGRITNQDQATSALSSSLFPCPPRTELMLSVVNQLPPDSVIPLLKSAVDLDPRCPGIAVLRADIAVQLDDLQEADQATALLVASDPLYYESWVLRGLYFVKINDLPAAQRALEEAERLLALRDDPGARERIDLLQGAIDQAQGAP